MRTATATLMLLLVMTVGAAAATFTVPPLTAPVVDQAGLLSSGVRQRLNATLRQLRDGGGSQIGVLIVDSLGGEPIEQASIKVTDAWKLGSATNDNGVLLFVAKEERGVRIEVGQGLEGALTDAYSRRIIDDVIVPRFRAGDFDGGVAAGVKAIVSYTDPNVTVAQGSPAGQPSTVDDSADAPPGRGALFINIMIIVFVSIIFRMLGGRRFSSGRSSGWYSSGGSRGGGGWGGGGGGFSGGGASGKW